jgi:hypothetical protein
MIRRISWLATANVLILLWQECGENPAVFCYRISMGAFSSAKARGYVKLPALQIRQRFAAACSNRSAIFSTPSTTLKD